ncbi:hypothetical protein HanOQP8_Chr02g0045141 [Helianthus annuus]|nr:hypothetical protein HanOQP8_Chr02g0045141 [Helianthus annuus]
MYSYCAFWVSSYDCCGILITPHIHIYIYIMTGVTVFLCGMAIAVLGSSVNAPTVMLANFVATPLELSLMVVFLRFGEFVTGGAHFPLTTDALKKVLTGEASTEIFRSILNAVCSALCIIIIVLIVENNNNLHL